MNNKSKKSWKEDWNKRIGKFIVDRIKKVRKPTPKSGPKVKRKLKLKHKPNPRKMRQKRK